MKRKLRIFSNIAIIALSVCMFAFGVYAANQISVTTSGTVSFTATDVFATVEMSVNSTTKNTVNDKSVTFEAGVAKDTEVWNNTDIQFKDDGSNIVMTFTVTNNATDRPMYVYMRDDSVATTKISKNIQNASSDYLGTEIEVAEGSSTTFTVTFTINDKNISIQESDGIEYSLFINLSNESYMNATFTSETNDETLGKVSDVTVDVANKQITLNATLEQNSEFLGWFEKSGETVGERVGDLLKTTISAKVGVTNYLAKFRTITMNTTVTPNTISYTFNDDLTATFGNGSYSCASLATSEGDTLVIPAQVRNDTDSVYTVTKIGDSVFGYGADSATFKKVIIANTIEEIGGDFLKDAPNIESVILSQNLKTLGTSSLAHGGDNIVEYILPEGFTTFVDGVFYNNFKVTIPSTLNIFSDYWPGYTSTVYDLSFNAGVDGTTAASLLSKAGGLQIVQITINGQSVLNSVESVCTSGRYYGVGSADGYFRVRVLKSLEETTPNAYLNNTENGFTKTISEDGLYNVYAKPEYYI